MPISTGRTDTSTTVIAKRMPAPNRGTITIIPRNQHTISRKNISDNALKVLYRLNKAGYAAYLVGGGVRDLLRGESPKDFDICTNATPEQVRKLFRNCRLIGRRFRLAHIMYGAEIIEVATLRGHHQECSSSIPKILHDNTSQAILPILHKDSQLAQNGRLLRDNIFGSIEEDAQRRDFTVNSLYYDIADFSLRDYTGGMQDLQAGVIRLIGDAETRYREDPVRMLRAVRFSVKLDMTISAETAALIPRLATLLNEIPAARLFEEVLKLLQSGHGYQTYIKLREYQLFQILFPMISSYFTLNNASPMEAMLTQVLKNTDNRLKTGKRVNPAFLFATMFWYPLLAHTEMLVQERELSYYDAAILASNDVLHEAQRTLSMPKRITLQIRDIWWLQSRFANRQGKRTQKLMEHLKFRAAYDLLALRAEVENNKPLLTLVSWWQVFQEAPAPQQKALLEALEAKTSPRHSRGRRTTAKLNQNSSEE